MAGSAKKKIDKLIGTALIPAEVIAQRLRRSLVSQLSRNKNLETKPELLRRAKKILRKFEPVFIDTMSNAEIAAWLTGLLIISRKMPVSILDVIIDHQLIGSKESEVDRQIDRILEQAAISSDDYQELVTKARKRAKERASRKSKKKTPYSVLDSVAQRFPSLDVDMTISEVTSGAGIEFPGIDNQIRELIARKVVTPSEFKHLSKKAKKKAYTIINESSKQTITTLRDAIVESLEKGDTIGDFRKSVEDVVDKSKYGPSKLEMIYRAHVTQAAAAGQEKLVSNPIVKSIFPYARYTAIDDGRVRDNHLALETLGLNGTNIYRADDPMWEKFTPPWEWNCRCDKTMLTARQAARAGVVEAQRMLEGKKITPTHQIEAITFVPDPNYKKFIHLTSS